jgi:membrane-associated phospholipid phosphatase
VDWLSPSIPFIIALQRFTQLKPLMQFLSFLGSIEFFLLVLPLCYWCFNRGLGWRLGLLVIGNSALNDILKVGFALPRPFWVSSQVKPLVSVPETGFGLPSGHAQGAAAFWTFLGLQFQNRTKRALAVGAAAGVTVLIALSRFYLGVHFPADALAGAIIGYAVLALFASKVDVAALAFRRLPQGARWALVFLVPLCLPILFALALKLGGGPGKVALYGEFVVSATSWKACAERSGALCGLLLGLLWESTRAPFSVAGTVGQKTARFVIGAIGIIVIWKGLAVLLPSDESLPAMVGRFVRYSALSAWIIALAPVVFVQLKLMERVPERGVAPL